MSKYFSDTCNILSGIAGIQEFPFPFAVTKQCFPEEIYNELVKTRPSWKAIMCGREIENNKRIDMPASLLLKSDHLAPIWRDFIEYHTSRNFYLKILDKFEGYFEEFYPHLTIMRKYKTAIRYSGDEADIYLDCQLSINTPVKEKSTVNTPHVDNPLELWASLLYMRDPEDTAGGDLVIHKCVRPPIFQGRREAEQDCIRNYARVGYQPNTFVCFVNSPISIHSVTERDITDSPRLLVNISLEFKKEPLFDI